MLFNKNKESPKKGEWDKSMFKGSKPTGPSPLDKEITIKINPRKVLHWLVFVILFLIVFFLGRWSAEPSCDVKEVGKAPSSSWNISGFFTDLWPDSWSFSGSKEVKPKNQTTAKKKTSTNTTKTVMASNTTTAAAESTPPTTPVTTANTTSTETVEETIITKYTKVAMALNGVKKTWYGTWGKVTAVEITIKNNEAGTVKPDYIKMMMEGYLDVEVKIPLPEKLRTIKSGSSMSTTIIVPEGFSYSDATAGNLQNVRIQLFLFNADGTAMASVSKDMDLSGTT